MVNVVAMGFPGKCAQGAGRVVVPPPVILKRRVLPTVDNGLRMGVSSFHDKTLDFSETLCAVCETASVTRFITPTGILPDPTFYGLRRRVSHSYIRMTQLPGVLKNGRKSGVEMRTTLEIF